MEELKNKVIERLDVDNIKEDKIKQYIELFQSKIKSICKRQDFPKELEYMCVEFARKRFLYYSNIDEGANKKVEVKSAKDINQSVDFDTTEIITADDVDIDKYVNRNIKEISNYAYMGW